MNDWSTRLWRGLTFLSRNVRYAARITRAILGVPNYERYLAHVHALHPQATPLTRDEFERQRLHDRYSRPGARCC
jgi:uncharacterized short protein YbdD (DUF466 family)